MRAIHAIRELALELPADLRSIALYTDPDEQAMFVREADERYGLGAATFVDPGDGQVKSSYLDLDRLEQALLRTRADAAWVGWGFVAEQATFAELCRAASASASSAPRRRPCAAPGTRSRPSASPRPWASPSCRGAVDQCSALAAAHREAARLGYPVMVKASAGGGGRGIRRVDDAEELGAALVSAQAEALEGLRRRHDVPRAAADRVPPHRGPDHRRRPRHRLASGSPGLLGAAAAPEAARGSAVSGAHERAGRRGPRRSRSAGRGHGLHQRQHGRVPLRRGHRAVRVHGGERPPAGRAPHHRGHDRTRPGEAAAPAGRWRAAGRRPSAGGGPCHRGPTQRRGQRTGTSPRLLARSSCCAFTLARACASTPGSKRATSSPPSSTR